MKPVLAASVPWPGDPMRTILKLTLGALAAVALAGAGLASAQGYGPDLGFGHPRAGPPHDRPDPARCDDNITVGECRALMGDPCNDAMTVGECKAAWDAKRQAECVEHTGNETLCRELANRPPPPPGGPHGHGGPGHPGPGGRPRGPPPGNETGEPS